MEFKKKLRKRLHIAIAYMVIGILLTLIAFITKTNNFFISAFGIGLLVNSILRLRQYRRITRDEQSIKKQQIAETDERNLMIAERARAWVFSFTVWGAGVAVILLSLLGYHNAALPFAWLVCGMAVLYWICWHIIRKKY